MRDVELYRHLLGLESPWTVRSVELNVQAQRVDVCAGHAEERVWRHLDSCQFLTYLHAQPPQVECLTHGVRQVRPPWAADGVQVSLALRRGESAGAASGALGPAQDLHAPDGPSPGHHKSLRELWHYTRAGWAERHWTRWYFWATHSRLTPVIDTARLIHRHLPQVLIFFAHPITNAISEGLNSRIQTIKKMVYGFRNREHFKTAIYFHCRALSEPQFLDHPGHAHR